MVEATANSIEDYLVDGLSFKLKKGASYINERKSVTYHPQGSNIYSTQGTKLIKLLVSGDQWLDPSTFRVMFDLVNMESDVNKELRVLGGPHSFFKRMRILCNGQIVEDIDDYNRVSEMFFNLTASDSKANASAEGFGTNFNIRKWMSNDLNKDNFRGIPGNQSRTVLFMPLSGLLSQQKYLPLRYMPITIELELVNDSTDPIISKFGTGDADFKAENTSLLWQIQNVMVKCDVCVLDNALDNSYTEHLLSGKALPINYNTFVSQLQSIKSGVNGQKSVRLNVTRALSRLKSVFVTLDKEVTSESAMAGRKKWNDFYSPMHATGGGPYEAYDATKEFEFQLQLGSKLYPEYPIRSHAESFYQLRKTMGHKSNSIHSIDIDSYEYRNHKFIIGVDMERVIEAGFTGMNTKAGDILNIRFDHRSTIESEYAHDMHVVLQSDNIMEVRDGGVQVFD